jgi:hypothetical protein
MDSTTPCRPLLTRLAAFTALFAIVAVLGSCGGDDDDDPGGGGEGGNSTAAFCDEVKSILTGDPGEGAEEQARQFQKAINRLQDVEPPDEIAKDWSAVMEAWDAQEAGDVDLEATQAAGRRIQQYLGDECGLTEQNTN